MSFLTTFSDKVQVLPASGQVIPVDCTGEFFLATSATGAFQISLEEGRPFFTAQVGFKFTTKGGQLFRRILMRSVSGSAVTVTFYTGVGDLQDQRVIIPPSASLPVVMQEADTTSASTGTVTIGSGAELVRNGTNGSGFRRKQIVMTNTDAALELQWRDSAQVLGGTIFPKSNVTLFTSSQVRIFNPNGSACGLNIWESFYTS